LTPLRFLLDTSAMLAHNRQESGWMPVQELLEGTESVVLAATVSLTEFARRLHELGATPQEARRLAEEYRELLDDLVPIDDQVALAAFEIACQTPERLPLVDALIAAAAREQGACLVHRDRHMAQIPSGVVEQLDLAKQAGQG
jgi:predicted nucleic acid-binding protein